MSLKLSFFPCLLSSPFFQWGADVTTAPIIPGAPAGGVAAGGTATTTPAFMAGDQDWSVGPTTSTKDWGADDTGDWGNTEPKVVANFCEYSGNTISFTEKTLWITHLCHQQTPRPQILRVYHVAENF